ncbi:uncharacterized protein B0H18DRAFT_1121203 [Fomitopsis serialis]|uniref:uncharacterized protein n=1 Tax=Fomitopsis serialis TaxID=139415 RepID=UPI0020081978|nr:uncharacterized protein B0H18DRAFT_1121203 [Neoantrodia serialis]KAH9921908.1 hypothetical protein B0H18DRAFT_1121203 [Neoantrodia serialis]
MIFSDTMDISEKQQQIQPLPAPGQPQPSRQISTTIQRAADDFVRLIESEKVKAREPLQRQLAALEHDHAQFREHAATTLDAALTRVGSVDDEIQKVKEVLAAREKEIENMRQVVAARDRDITQLREQHMSLGAPGTDRISGSQHQREGVEVQVLRMREALEKEHNELVASKNAQIEALNAHIAKLEAELVELRSKDEDIMMAEASRDYLNIDECEQHDGLTPFADCSIVLSAPSPVEEDKEDKDSLFSGSFSPGAIYLEFSAAPDELPFPEPSTPEPQLPEPLPLPPVTNSDISESEEEHPSPKRFKPDIVPLTEEEAARCCYVSRRRK